MGSTFRLIFSAPIALIVTLSLFLLIYFQLEPRPLLGDAPAETGAVSLDNAQLCIDDQGRVDSWCGITRCVDCGGYVVQPQQPDNNNSYTDSEKAAKEKPRPEDLPVRSYCHYGCGPDLDISRYDTDSVYRGPRPDPRYPLTCRRKRAEGTVTVEFDVTPEGRIANARVTSAPDRCFRRPMLRYIEKWRYRPLLGADGKYLWRQGIVERFTFTLND